MRGKVIQTVNCASSLGSSVQPHYVTCEDVVWFVNGLYGFLGKRVLRAIHSHRCIWQLLVPCIRYFISMQPASEDFFSQVAKCLIRVVPCSGSHSPHRPTPPGCHSLNHLHRHYTEIKHTIRAIHRRQETPSWNLPRTVMVNECSPQNGIHISSAPVLYSYLLVERAPWGCSFLWDNFLVNTHYNPKKSQPDLSLPCWNGLCTIILLWQTELH